MNFEGDDARKLPTAAADLLRAYVRGQELAPVARLHTVRRGVEIGDEAGRRLAVVTDDEASVMDGRRVASRFRELEAELVYDEFAWFLYGELWDVSVEERPELAEGERRARIDELLDPLLDPTVADGDRAALVVDAFRAVLAARLVPLLG